MNSLLDFIALIGRALLGACSSAGKLTLFALSGISHIVRPPFYGRMFLRAFVEIG